MPSNRWAKFFILCLLCSTLLVAISAFWFSNFLSQTVTPPQAEIISIKPGSSFTRVAHDLEQAGIISDAWRFILLARWQGAAARIHAGEYVFERAARPEEVLARLTAGDVRKLQLTIPEGFNLAEIAMRIEAAGIAGAEVCQSLARDPALLNELGIAAGSLEGYLFPETYTYTTDTTLKELLTAMVEQFRKQLTPEMLAAGREHGLNEHQLVTLASIIQKEAGHVAEMPLISAVFHNRLKLGIPLQADPTVIYGVSDFDGNLTRRHLQEETPYNTYRRRGLPPGPIASPGAEALSAAAFPADVKYLYFVSRGDGTHEFNTSLQGHNRAVQRYQLRR